MRTLMCAALMLAMSSSAFAQQPLSTCMDNDGHGRKVSQVFGPPAQQAQKYMQVSDWTDARGALDAMMTAAQTRFEHAVTATMELTYAKATGDVSHLETVWAPLVANGCLSEAELAKLRSDVAAGKQR